MQSRGFTLIELLVAISIISILVAAVVLLVNPFSQLARARDAERRNTLKELQTALELYRADNGSYPVANWFVSEEGQASPLHNTNSGDWIPGLTPKYIRELPTDPKGDECPLNSSWKRSYVYVSNGAEYALIAHCSPEVEESLNDPDDPYYDPQRSSWGWKVCEGETGCSW